MIKNFLLLNLEKKPEKKKTILCLVITGLFITSAMATLAFWLVQTVMLVSAKVRHFHFTITSLPVDRSRCNLTSCAEFWQPNTLDRCSTENHCAVQNVPLYYLGFSGYYTNVGSVGCKGAVCHKYYIIIVFIRTVIWEDCKKDVISHFHNLI